MAFVSVDLSWLCRGRQLKFRKLLIQKGSLDRPALRVVFGRDAGLGQRIEKGGLADVGQAHDAALKTYVGTFGFGG